MSHKATIYPDIESLLAQITGMKAKLAEFKAFRANYQNMRNLWKFEHRARQLESGWVRKLEKSLANVIEAEGMDSIDIKKYAEKVLASKPQAML